MESSPFTARAPVPQVSRTLHTHPVVSLVLVTLLFSATACQANVIGKRESMTIGTPPLESSALIYVADARHLFTQNGLEVVLQNYETGASALDGLVNGQVDIAVPAEYALVGKAFNRDKVRAIASIDKVEYFSLVARRDHNIQDIPDLKGKKIGVVRKTIAEFYLGRFLQLHGISPDQVTVMDVGIAQSEAAISDGSVDAIMARPPTLTPILEQLGANAVSWQAQASQALYALLIVRDGWIAEHPEAVRRLYRALVQAEEYLIGHPVEAKTIVQQRLGLSDADMPAIWSQNQFSLTLEQSLILSMEDEARWMIQNGLTNEKAVPDFLEHVYADGLKAVKPEAVNLIR